MMKRAKFNIDSKVMTSHFNHDLQNMHSSVVFTSYSDKSSDKSSDEDDDGKEDPDKKKFESQLSGEDIFP